MKFQKYILCAAVALTAFGAGLGLFNLGRYFGTAFAPQKMPVVTIPELPSPTIAPIEVKYEIPVTVKPEENDPAKEPSFCSFDAGGNYYLIDTPKEFEGFDSVTIVTRDYQIDPQKEDGTPIKPKGTVFTNNEYEIARIKIGDQRISFTTQTKKGVSYQFEGKFIDETEVKVKGSDGETYTDYAVLEGRLRKYRNGQVVADSKVKLGENCGC